MGKKQNEEGLMLDDIQIAVLASTIKSMGLIGTDLGNDARKILRVIKMLREEERG